LRKTTQPFVACGKSRVLKGHDFSRAVSTLESMLGFSPRGKFFSDSDFRHMLLGRAAQSRSLNPRCQKRDPGAPGYRQFDSSPPVPKSEGPGGTLNLIKSRMRRGPRLPSSPLCDLVRRPAHRDKIADPEGTQRGTGPDTGMSGTPGAFGKHKRKAGG